MSDKLTAALQTIIRPEELADWLNDNYAELSARAGFEDHIAHCIDVEHFERVGSGWGARAFILHKPRGAKRSGAKFAPLSKIFAGFPVKADDVMNRIFLADADFPRLAVFQRLAGVF